MNAWDISFSSLSVGYGDHAVLHDINATLPGGKVSVILGGSGCGKSTLLRHIIGLSRPIGGSLRIGGQDLFSLPHAEARRIRRRMGVLFQDGALLGALTLVQNVCLPLSEHLRLPRSVLREAGLRAPQSISHTVSLVGALIIGETAVSAGIVSVPVLTMAAAATIATLAVPSLYEQSILFRFAVIVLAGCFGVPGLACAALTILAMACGSEPFGYDYLYPLMPPGRASVRDGFVRSIWSRLAKSGEVISRHEA